MVSDGLDYCGDGYAVPSLLINGTYPGPLIEGNWGDWFEITVINNLSNYNGTSIHWHGLRQWNTVFEDGVGGVTQCPIPVSIDFILLDCVIIITFIKLAPVVQLFTGQGPCKL